MIDVCGSGSVVVSVDVASAVKVGTAGDNRSVRALAVPPTGKERKVL